VEEDLHIAQPVRAATYLTVVLELVSVGFVLVDTEVYVSLNVLGLRMVKCRTNGRNIYVRSR
jgi:hypothetical protein